MLLLLPRHNSDVDSVHIHNLIKDTFAFFPADTYHLRNERFQHFVTDFKAKHTRNHQNLTDKIMSAQDESC